MRPSIVVLMVLIAIAIFSTFSTAQNAATLTSVQNDINASAALNLDLGLQGLDDIFDLTKALLTTTSKITDLPTLSETDEISGIIDIDADVSVGVGGVGVGLDVDLDVLTADLKSTVDLPLGAALAINVDGYIAGVAGLKVTLTIGGKDYLCDAQVLDNYYGGTHLSIILKAKIAKLVSFKIKCFGLKRKPSYKCPLSAPTLPVFCLGNRAHANAITSLVQILLNLLNPFTKLFNKFNCFNFVKKCNISYIGWAKRCCRLDKKVYNPKTNKCDSCPAGTVFSIDKCIPACPNGSKLDGNTCKCIDPNQYIKNGQCTSCPTNTQPNEAGTACEPECKIGDSSAKCRCQFAFGEFTTDKCNCAGITDPVKKLACCALSKLPLLSIPTIGCDIDDTCKPIDLRPHCICEDLTGEFTAVDNTCDCSNVTNPVKKLACCLLPNSKGCQCKANDSRPKCICENAGGRFENDVCKCSSKAECCALTIPKTGCPVNPPLVCKANPKEAGNYSYAQVIECCKTNTDNFANIYPELCCQGPKRGDNYGVRNCTSDVPNVKDALFDKKDYKISDIPADAKGYYNQNTCCNPKSSSWSNDKCCSCAFDAEKCCLDSKWIIEENAYDVCCLDDKNPPTEPVEKICCEFGRKNGPCPGDCHSEEWLEFLLDKCGQSNQCTPANYDKSCCTALFAPSKCCDREEYEFKEYNFKECCKPTHIKCDWKKQPPKSDPSTKECCTQLFNTSEWPSVADKCCQALGSLSKDEIATLKDVEKDIALHCIKRHGGSCPA